MRESKAVQKVSGYAQRSTGADLPDKESEPSDGSGEACEPPSHLENLPPSARGCLLQQSISMHAASSGALTRRQRHAGSGLASMHALVSLASALNNTDADGRVVVDAAGGTLKFLLLNAAAHFTKVCPHLSLYLG